jgi:magnesium transporter
MTLRALYDYVIATIVTAGKYHSTQTKLAEDNLYNPVSLRRTRQASVSSLEEAAAALPSPPNVSMQTALSSIPESKTVLPSPPRDPAGPEKQLSVKSVVTNANASGQEQQVVTIRERLGGYLHPRDMRRLVSPFSPSNEPELMVRRHVILLNVDPLRAIVLRDRLLVIVPDGADSILVSLEKKVRGGIGIDEIENQFFGDYSSNSSHLSEVVNPVTKEIDYVPTTLVEGLETVNADEGTADQTHISKGLEERVDNMDSNTSLGDNPSESDSGISFENGDDDEDIGDGDEVEDCDEKDGDSATTVYSEYELEMDNEWDEFEAKDWIEMTFELQSVDAVLSSVVKMLADDSLSLRKKIFHVMEELRGDGTSSIPGDHVQEQLRILKDRAREMEGRVQGFVRAINQILDDEEDMALMNLSRLITNPERFIQPVSQDVLNEESDEPELILEVYLQQALSEVNALVLLKGNITNTEELVSLQMDTIRNRLLYINTVVSAVSLSVTVASLVGSLFGMNLKNHMEDDPNLFVEVVSGTLVGVVVMLVSILVLISRTGVMPANPRNVLYSKRRIDVDVAQSNSSTAQNSGG